MFRPAADWERIDELRERMRVCAELEERIVELRSPPVHRRERVRRAHEGRRRDGRASTDDRFAHADGDDPRVFVAQQLLGAARRGEPSKRPGVDYGDGEVLSHERASALWAIRLHQRI